MSKLYQTMDCRLFSTKPFPKSMITYCQLDPQEIWIITQNFYLKKNIWKAHLQNYRPCCQCHNVYWLNIDLELLTSLTHWGRVMHKCVSNQAIIGSDNGLLPGRCQAIIWTNVGILSIGPLGTNFSEILIEIQTFSFKKMHLKMSSVKQWPFCPGEMS